MTKLVQNGKQRLDQFGQGLHQEGVSVNVQAERQKPADALNRAEKLIADTGK